MGSSFFFFKDTATTEIYTLSLHDALPISAAPPPSRARVRHWLADSAVADAKGRGKLALLPPVLLEVPGTEATPVAPRSEEHTSELQSRQYLVCRLLLEKKTKNNHMHPETT